MPSATSRLTLLFFIVASGISVLAYQMGRNAVLDDVLMLQIENQSDQPLSSVVIEHGNFNTQEKIQVINLRPAEVRMIALNHQSGLGFDIEVNYSDGRTTSGCVGKESDLQLLPVKVTAEGVFAD